jgi:hypothetical protein
MLDAIVHRVVVGRAGQQVFLSLADVCPASRYAPLLLRHCKFHTGPRPTPLDETVPGPLSRRKPGPMSPPLVPPGGGPRLPPGKRAILAAIANRFVSC